MNRMEGDGFSSGFLRVRHLTIGGIAPESEDFPVSWLDLPQLDSAKSGGFDQDSRRTRSEI